MPQGDKKVRVGAAVKDAAKPYQKEKKSDPRKGGA